MAEVVIDRPRNDTRVSLTKLSWNENEAELYVDSSDGKVDINRDEARLIAKMLMDWAGWQHE